MVHSAEFASLQIQVCDREQNQRLKILHGPDGSGTDTAPPLAEAPILQDADALYDTISQGRLEQGMPNWGQVLSPAEINDVITYLGMLRAGETAPPEPVEEEGPDPLEMAQFFYLSQCATCHGLAGEGKDDKPVLIANDFIQNADDAELLRLISDGRANTAMEGFADVLDEEKIQTVIMLIRSWQ